MVQASGANQASHYALVRALGIERPIHLAGWSTGGGAAAPAIAAPAAVHWSFAGAIERGR